MEQQESRAQDDRSTDAAKPRTRRRNVKIGVVVSDKMQKTVVVAVERLVQHWLYRKTIRRTSTFMAHDEKGAHKGDTVRIVETRPLSKRKRWQVDEILERGSDIDVGVIDLPDVAL